MIRCTKCGYGNVPTSNFCISCGNAIRQSDRPVSRVELTRLEDQILELRGEIERISEALALSGHAVPAPQFVEPVPVDVSGATQPEVEQEPDFDVEPVEEPGRAFEPEPAREPEPVDESEPPVESMPVFEPEPVLPVPLAPAAIAAVVDPWNYAGTTTPHRQRKPAREPGARPTDGPPPIPGWGLKDINWEPIIGGNWLARVGALAVIIGVAFFLNLAFENNWISESGRILLGIGAGLAFLAAGEYWRKRYSAYAQALSGTGIAILYLAIFAAFSIYALIHIYTGIGVLLLISVTSAVIAIRQNSISLAILGILGAFLGPFILGSSVESGVVSERGSTGNAIGLLAYIFVVDVGVIVLSTFRSWRWFTALAFAGSLITFGLWLSEYTGDSSVLVEAYGRPESRLIAEAGLTGIFLSFVAATTLFHLVWRRNPEARDLTLMLVNATFYVGISYGLLWSDLRDWMGGFTILVAMLYAGVGYIALRRVGLVPIDVKNPARDMLLTSISFGIGLILLTAAIPIQIGGPWVPVVWASESVILLWLSFNQRMPEIRVGALAILAGAAVWLGVVETPDALRESVTPFWNRYLPPYLAVTAAFWIGAWLVRLNSAQLRNEERDLFPALTVIGFFFMALGTPVQVADSWLPVAWTLEAVAALWVAFKLRVPAIRYAALALLGVGALWLGAVETPGALGESRTPFWNHHLPVYLIVIAGIWTAAFLTRLNEDQLSAEEKIQLPLLALAGIFLLALGTPLQVGDTWLPVAWTVEAVALVWVAFNQREFSIRYGGLAVLVAGAVWLGAVETPKALDESITPFWNLHLPVYLIVITGIWTVAYLTKRNEEQLRQEEKSLFSIVALVGIFFLALGAPLQVNDSWLPVAWTVEAVALIWIAFNQRERAIRYGAMAVLAAGAIWLGVSQTPDAIRASLTPFWNQQFPVYVIVIAGIWFAAFLAKRNEDQLKTEESDLFQVLSVTGVFFVALGTAVQVSGPWMAFAWAIEGLAVIWISLRLGIFEAQVSGLALFGIAAVRALGFDSVVDGDGYTVLWNNRLLAFGPLIVSVAAAAYIWGKSSHRIGSIEPRMVSGSMAVAANFFALWFLSAEVIGAVQADAVVSVADRNENDAVSLGLTILWGVYGVLVLAAGFIGDWRLVRSGGLILLAIPVFKLFLFDSFQLEQGLRVAAFLVLGAILLAGGYLYQRHSELIKELFIRPSSEGPLSQSPG